MSNKYWENLFRSEGVTDREAQKELVVKKKREIIDYLTGAENSGKALFSSYYMTPDGKEQRDIRINKIDTEKEGGDWSTDIQEAVNMFATRTLSCARHSSSKLDSALACASVLFHHASPLQPRGLCAW